MAISNSNSTASSLASIAAKTVENKIAATPVAQGMEQGKQTIEKVRSAASTFSTLFSLAQQATDTSKPGPKGQQENDFIGAIQQNLFGSLGMEQNSGGSLEQKLKALTNDESIEKLQAAFLMHLQQNLFTPKQPEAPEQGTLSTEAKSTGAEQQPLLQPRDRSPLKTLERLSFGDNGLDLSDGFDTVNVLNHVPVVSEFYKNFAGRDVSAISKLAGGYLYGGPTGLAFSALDLASNSLFDNSISGLLANFDYKSLLSASPKNEVEQTPEVKEQQQARVIPNENSVYWPNTYVPDYKKDIK